MSLYRHSGDSKGKKPWKNWKLGYVQGLAGLCKAGAQMNTNAVLGCVRYPFPWLYNESRTISLVVD